MRSRWMLKLRFVSVLLVLVLVVSSLPLAGAQTDAGQRIEIVGLVEAMTLQTITVNQQVIDVTQAEFYIGVALAVPVKVQGFITPDGRIVAREVRAIEDDDDELLPGEIEITGLLTSIEGFVYTIAGQMIDGSRAEIGAGVAVGLIVKAHVIVDADGIWTAREIKLVRAQDDDDDDNGNVNDNGNDNANVNDNSNSNDNGNVNTNGNTNDNDDNGNDNANVNTNGNTNDNDDNGNDNDDDDDDVRSGIEIRLVGTLTGMTSESVTISGLVIDIRGADVRGALLLGTLVDARIRLVDGRWGARRIELASRAADNDNDDDDDNDNDDNDNVAVVTCATTTPPGWTTYTVRAGDSLSAIAAGARTTIEELARVNCLSDIRTIFVGQTLFVPRTPTGIGNSNDNDDDDDNGNSNSNGNSNDDDDDDDDNGDDDDD